MLRIFYIIYFFYFLFFISCINSNSANKKIENIDSIENKDLYQFYLKKYSNMEILTFLEGDFTGDDIDDFIIIFKESNNANKLVGIYKNSNNKILMTSAIPAPIENYSMSFYNIDEKVPNEILVSGKKGANIGFAIYRFENGELISLFENGMEKCC